MPLFYSVAQFWSSILQNLL